MIGSHHRYSDYYEVGREKIREYARAVQDAHPAHHREPLVAPLTFTSSFGMLAVVEFFVAQRIKVDFERILHTEQRFVYHRPLQVGDRLYCDVYFDAYREVGPSATIVVRAEITDVAGEPVQTITASLVKATGSR
ncbi:MaoC family dehydratase [Skermania sp. ID1734]|nr:MaoC family dehydratase [Skermania sp. ID1734]